MIKLEITDDRKVWDQVFGAAKMLDGEAVFTGIFDEDLAALAARHELGHGVPERPFAGPSADQATQRALATAERQVGLTLDGKQDPTDALEEIGEVFGDAMRNYVELGRVGGDPLSDAAKQADSRKLIETGDMIGAVEVKVAKSIPGEDA